MADSVNVANMPDPGSKEAVALNLWHALKDGSDDIEKQLELYAKCLEATYRGGQYHANAFPRR